MSQRKPFDVRCTHKLLMINSQYFRWNKNDHLIYSIQTQYNAIYNSIWLSCKKPVWIYGIVTYITQMVSGSKVNSWFYERKTFVRHFCLVSFCFYVCGSCSTNVQTSIDVHCRQECLVASFQYKMPSFEFNFYTWKWIRFEWEFGGLVGFKNIL